MRDLNGRVAVITGAASGIGRAMANRFAREGMKVVLADVEPDPLSRAEEELERAGFDVLAVSTDVADHRSVEELAAKTLERFGKVHLLCNNAGVAAGGDGALWTTTERDWAWVLGVNLMGVVHGIQIFVPSMLAHGEEGHILNTSSVLGLTSGKGSVYEVSKHAVTRLSEGLHHDLVAAGSRLGVSVLCPGLVATAIIESDRNRPPELRNEVAPEPQQVVAARRAERRKFLREHGMAPDEIATAVLEGIKEQRFYILTHPELKAQIAIRMKNILEDRSPSVPAPSRLRRMLSSLYPRPRPR
ncbi:MAG: SDR family NAD(P)-dependent oxidoreductase [Gemmatimonadota bacterium]